MDGTSQTAEVTANTVHAVEDGIIEQDIVKRLETHLPDGRQRITYEESVLQFKQVSGDVQAVRAARVSYNGDRVMIRKLVLEGSINRRWQPFADQISAQLNKPWDVIEKFQDIR